MGEQLDRLVTLQDARGILSSANTHAILVTQRNNKTPLFTPAITTLPPLPMSKDVALKHLDDAWYRAQTIPEQEDGLYIIGPYFVGSHRVGGRHVLTCKIAYVGLPTSRARNIDRIRELRGRNYITEVLTFSWEPRAEHLYSP